MLEKIFLILKRRVITTIIKKKKKNLKELFMAGVF